eukprot:gene25414-biopygen26293
MQDLGVDEAAPATTRRVEEIEIPCPPHSHRGLHSSCHIALRLCELQLKHNSLTGTLPTELGELTLMNEIEEGAEATRSAGALHPPVLLGLLRCTLNMELRRLAREAGTLHPSVLLGLLCCTLNMELRRIAREAGSTSGPCGLVGLCKDDAEGGSGGLDSGSIPFKGRPDAPEQIEAFDSDFGEIAATHESECARSDLSARTPSSVEKFLQMWLYPPPQGQPWQVISTLANGAEGVYATDLDGDGDMDVLSASNFDDKIAWYANDGSGGFGSQLVITTLAKYARSVYAADVDGDGDMDVLSASFEDDK